MLAVDPRAEEPALTEQLASTRILALETSGTSGSVAASQGSKLLLRRQLNPAQRSAQSLAPAISTLLAEVGWQPSDVQLVAVTIGPGSFTGLRVGVTTAKMFAFAVGADVLGVNTLEAIAEQSVSSQQSGGEPLCHEGMRLRAVIDAHRQELFVGGFECSSDGLWKWRGEAAIEPVEKFLATDLSGELLSGPGLEKLVDRLPDGALLAPRDIWQPMAESVARIAARRHAAGERDDLVQLLPLYLRRSAAEEKWDERQNRGS